MAPSSSTGSTTPKMLPPLQLRAQKLHAVLLKIVQHGWIACGAAQKGGSKILVHDCEVVVEQSEALLKKLRGRNPDLRDYWDPDSQLRVPKPEEIRREKIRHLRRNKPLLVRLRNIQVRASQELQPDRG